MTIKNLRMMNINLEEKFQWHPLLSLIFRQHYVQSDHTFCSSYVKNLMIPGVKSPF